MADPKQVRQIALSFPETEEQQHHGHPDFRVRKKIFTTLWPAESRAVIKLQIADQTALVQSNPQAFSLNSWSHQGWTNVHLEHLDTHTLRDVIEVAWRNVAPKKVVAAFDASA